MTEPLPDLLPHHWRLRVYYEDTDAGGIVYYANYLRFFERARTEYLRALAIDHATLKTSHGLIFAVRNCSVDYRAPARLDDWLDIVTSLTAIGASRLDMRQDIRHEEQIITTAQITVVAVGLDGRAKRLPEALRQRFQPFVAPSAAAVV